MSTFNSAKRTYHVRDYSGCDTHDPEAYDIAVGRLTWEQARDWVDKNTTDETAGDYAIHADDPPNFHMVCIVLEDRAYGGPEEGGWWYDTFNPDDYEAKWLTHEAGGPWIFQDSEAALKKCREINQLLKDERVNDGRSPIDSIISRGQYAAYIYDGYPHYVPREIPHYE